MLKLQGLIPAKKMDNFSLRHLTGSDIDLKLPEIFVPDIDLDILPVDQNSLDIDSEMS